MPTRRLRFGACAALIAGLPILAGAQQTAIDESPRAQRTPLVLGEAVTFHSEILAEDRLLLVNLAGRDAPADQSLPVIFLLDGGTNFQHTAASVDLLVRSGRMPPSIVVAITNTDRNRDFTTSAREGLSSGGADRFLDFLTLELIPFVDATYPTAPHRTLIGHSLGGLLVMHAVAERPGLFQAAISISPALTNGEQVDGDSQPISRRVATALENDQSNRFTLFITMSEAEDSRAVRDLKTLLDVLAASSPEEMRWEYRLMEGEDHVTTVLPSTFHGLRFVHADWDTSGIMEKGTVADLAARYALLSDTMGTEISPPEAMVNVLGYRRLRDGRIDDAIEAFELNVALHPTSANVHDSLGEALEQAGRLPGALRCYRRAVERAEATKDPFLATYRTNLDRVETALFGSVGRTPAPLGAADPDGP
jgi:predicted alpha/beta superfamily hydrolase